MKQIDLIPREEKFFQGVRDMQYSLRHHAMRIRDLLHSYRNDRLNIRNWISTYCSLDLKKESSADWFDLEKIWHIYDILEKNNWPRETTLRMHWWSTKTPELKSKYFYNELSPETQSEIKSFEINSIVVSYADPDTITEIFMWLQEGVRLNPAERLDAEIQNEKSGNRGFEAFIFRFY